MGVDALDPANGGGRIKEDNTVALARNGKPSKQYRASLHTANKQDFERLVAGTLEAIVAGHEFVLLKVNYLTTWPADFPKGKIIRQEGKFDIRSIRARRLLKWLQDKGHTKMTLEKIRGLRIKVGQAIYDI
jgi:hypothetical protein